MIGPGARRSTPSSCAATFRSRGPRDPVPARDATTFRRARGRAFAALARERARLRRGRPLREAPDAALQRRAGARRGPAGRGRGRDRRRRSRSIRRGRCSSSASTASGKTALVARCARAPARGLDRLRGRRRPDQRRTRCTSAQLEGRIEELVERLAGSTRSGCSRLRGGAVRRHVRAAARPGCSTRCCRTSSPARSGSSPRSRRRTTSCCGEAPARAVGASARSALRPLDEAETVAIARARPRARRRATSRPTSTCCAEAYELAQQFLPGIAQPGGSMRLLEATVDAVSEREATSVRRRRRARGAGRLSGLPLALLDPSAPLDLDAVRAFFDERVLGQEEAVGHRRPDRARQGRADRPDSAARRVPLRRPDRHRARPSSRRRWPSSCSARRAGSSGST